MGAALSECRHESGCMPGVQARSWDAGVSSETDRSQLPGETLIQFVDEKRGMPYYYDLKTGETTWETPEQFLVHPSVVEWMESAYEGASPIARATRHASEFNMVQPPAEDPLKRDGSRPVKQSGVRIAVLCTVEEEAEPLRKMMSDACEHGLKGCARRTRGKIKGKLVDLVVTGKGKINASCAVVALCYESSPNSHLAAILSLGTTTARAGEGGVIVCSGAMMDDSEGGELQINADAKLLACTQRQMGDVNVRICEGPVDESWVTLMCPKKHPMCKVSGLPKSYVGKHIGVFCDKCELTGLEYLGPFWHCAECGWDYCSTCSEEKGVNRIVRSPRSWSVEHERRQKIGVGGAGAGGSQEKFGFVVSEDREVSAMATVAKKFQVPFLAIQEVMDQGPKNNEAKSSPPSSFEGAGSNVMGASDKKNRGEEEEGKEEGEEEGEEEEVIGGADKSTAGENISGGKRTRRPAGAAAMMAAQVISEFEPA